MMPCGHACKKLLLDCQGELMEAINNVPLVAVNGGLSHDAMTTFSDMTTQWAAEYLAWKAEHISFTDDDDNQ